MVIFLINENDMDTMYSQYAEAQEIQLWCDGRCDELDNTDSVAPPKKRSRQGMCNSKRSAIQEEVEGIQIGTHKDYNMPPDVPVWWW